MFICNNCSHIFGSSVLIGHRYPGQLSPRGKRCPKCKGTNVNLIYLDTEGTSTFLDKTTTTSEKVAEYISKTYHGVNITAADVDAIVNKEEKES